MANKQLLKKLQGLQYLGLNLDPFNAKLSKKMIKLLEEFQLKDDLEKDPYQFTNKLLRLIDETQEQIKQD